jgi:hypothetical protein
MMENGKMIRDMVMESIFIQMAKYMKGSGRIMSKRAKASTSGLQVRCIKVNGKTIKRMVLVYICMKTEIVMKANGRTIWNMAKVNIFIVMVLFMMVIGTTINKVEKASFNRLNEDKNI